MVDLDVESIRVTLHIVAVAVWVGGQIVMAAMIPVLRSAGPDVPRRAAARFGRVAWPFFALGVVTGIWNLAEVDLGATDTSYQVTLVAKLLVVGLSGGAAAVHSLTGSRPLRAFTGALALLSALVALFMGVLLAQ